MIKTALIISFLLLSILLFIATRSGDFKVSHSLLINAPAERIAVEIIDFRRWNAWSPWAPLDPQATLTYSGTESGVGAVFHWDGNEKVGEGEMTIKEYVPHERILMSIVFMKPFKASNIVEFNFTPEKEQTLVTWSMSGKNNFVGKAMGLFINCDQMVGEMYLQGLHNLKETVENHPQP